VREFDDSPMRITVPVVIATRWVRPMTERHFLRFKIASNFVSEDVFGLISLEQRCDDVSVSGNNE
jgi:hypothetical protein